MTNSDNNSSSKSILLLCSGGVDSVLLAHRYKDDIKVLMFFDYGQPASRQEMRATRFTGSKLNIPVEMVSIPLQSKALEGDGPCVVPERNLVMVAYALHYAAVNDIDLVFYGAILNDRMDYIDCRPEWVRLLRRARHAQAWELGSNHPKIPELEAPLITTTKEEIVSDAVALGVDLSKTWSCYNPSGRKGLPCGHCASCRLFIDAIAAHDNKNLFQDAP